MSIQYVPRESAYYYGVFTDLAEDLTSYGAVKNPYDFPSQQQTHFFLPDERSRTATTFVIETLSKSGEIDFDDNGQLPDDNRMTIRDSLTYYDVEVVAEYWDFHCNIDKSDGRIYDTMTGELEADWDAEEEPEEEN